MRRRSVRSSAISTEPAAKIPTSTITNVASKLLSICKSPFSLYSQSGSYILFGGFPVQTAAGSRVTCLDAPPQHFARLAAFALTEPLAIPSSPTPDLVLDLPKHRE